jgi:hypothetical protein
MRPVMVSRRALGWLSLLAAVAAAGCTATPASSPAAPGHSRTASPAAVTAVRPTAVPPPAPSGSATAGPGGIRDLVVSQDVRNELTAAYLAYRGIPPSDVAGTDPGSVYYAYDPATGTYWAQAEFEPSGTASLKVLVSFQDGASFGFFTRAGTGRWQVRLGGAPVPCAEARFFPPSVLEVWSLPAATAGSGCDP